MDNVVLCDGVELCLDSSNIYILNDGKRKDLTNKSGKVLNSLYFLFGQYLKEHEISFDFKDNLDKIGISNINVMSKQFMNLHLLENNHDGRVFTDCGNNLIENIIGYVSGNPGVHDSIKNLHYLGLFDKCQNLIGDGGYGDLDSIIDTKASDTYPEDTIVSAPVSPVDETLIDGYLVPDPVDAADSISDNQAKVDVNGKYDFSNVEETDVFKHSLEDYLLTYDFEKDGKFYFFINTNGEIFPLAVDLLSFALHTMVPNDAEVASSINYRNLKTASSPTKLKNIGFLDSNKDVTDVAITYIEESLIPMFEKLLDKELLDFEVKYKYERYLFLRKKFSEIDFDDSVPALSVKEPADDDCRVPDSVDAVDLTEAEDYVVPDQGEIDASAYPLSGEEIELAVGRDILVWDGDRLVVTDEGRKHDIFMILYSDKIDAVNNLAVSDTPEEVLYTEDLDKAYYSIAERTDKYEGVSIFFEGNEIPIVTLKIYDEGKKMLLSPQVYALNIICMADKLGVELTKDLLEDKLEVFAHTSAKHWASLLEVDGCITYDGRILKSGQKLRDVVDLANIYLEGKYESFEKPIQTKYISYPRIKRLLTHKDDFSISGDQTVPDIKDSASNNNPVEFSDSKPIHRPRDNKLDNFNRSAKPEGISGIESNNGDLTITYYGHDGSGADKESLPVKRLQVNDTLTPAGERLNLKNGNSADSIVDALKEFKLLDSIGDLNEYGEVLSKKMNMDWNSIL